MRNFKWVLTALLLATTICFMACETTKVASTTNDAASEPTGPYKVGDIVLNDGSSIAYTPELTLTGQQKAKAIAVIYKVEGGKAYGVGLVQNTKGLAWCLNSAKGFETKISAIECTPGASGRNMTFTGDTDGSDNFAKIGEALGNNDDTNDLSKYPAFEFAINYKDKAGSHVKGTAYETGWYLPALSELLDIWLEKKTVNAASKICGGSEFANRWYWSSSQDPDNDTAYLLNFELGGAERNVKMEDTNFVCCIRIFG